MGMPGSVTIKITTTFNEEENSVSRSIQFVDGNGLNSLVTSEMGSEESWGVNKDVMADTIGLPDGVHTIELLNIKNAVIWIPVQEN